jgi:transposase-like protein
MVSDLFFSQLMLIALLWRCVMLHWVGPSDPTMASPTLLPVTLPPPKRSREPQPFAGLTRKPHCDACEHARDSRLHAPSASPPRIVMTRGRRREVDTSRHCCPNPDCPYRGWVGWGNLRANGHPNGGPWRQLLCVVCRRSFLETLGTLLHGKHASVELIVRVIACLADGMGIRGTARVCEVAPNTVLPWLVAAAEPLRAFSRYVLHDVRGRQVQLDELFALLSAVKDGEVSAAAAVERLERSPQGVWVALDPERKRLLTIEVGNRTLARAQRFVHQVAQGLAPDCAPLLLTDGFRESLTAVLTHDGDWGQPLRRQGQGPLPQPRWRPLPQLLYAPVLKTVRRRRLVRVSHRVVFGTLEAVNAVLAPHGWHSHTAFVERINLTIRPHVAAVGRRGSPLCKGADGLHQQWAVFHCYSNFCLPHASLRLPLPQPESTHGSGAATQWRPRTPAMVAGLTDHVWTLREVLMFRVPPWPQPARV